MYNIVTLSKYTQADYEDADEEPVVTYTPIAETIHAERIYLTGFERFLGEQTKAGERIKYKIDHRSDIDEKDILTDGAIDYDIKAIQTVGRDRYLLLLGEVTNKENQINP